MTLPPPPDRWTIELANAERVEAIAAFGFTERQARFLLNVLLHSGVFIERQYCSSAGLVHGQMSTDFIKTLIERRFATPIATGKLHRGRMFHVHYKPLWAAIGEPDNRFRKPTAQGRMIERVMLLDAVLDHRDFTWLGPSTDKRRHFMRHLGDRLDSWDYPHLLFGWTHEGRPVLPGQAPDRDATARGAACVRLPRDTALADGLPALPSAAYCALETGMRRGEMLALRFGDIDWTRRMITLRGATTKSRRTRLVPIGTARLLAVLAWLRLDSAGEHKADDVPVFSNEAGEALKTFKKAWVVAVLKAHGVDPRWRRGSYKNLSTECQRRFRDIKLHWHDLRHEYASRLVERGAPLAQVRDLLGHASILTTERYDNQRLEALQAAVERLEGGKTIDPQTEAADKVSRIFQVAAEQRFAQSEDPIKDSTTRH